MEKIKVFYKRPDSPGYMTNVSNTLQNLQKNVGGYIETITIMGLGKDRDQTVVVICNEEGKLRGLPYNCKVLGEPIMGDFMICGVDGEEFADIPISIREVKEMLAE